METSLDKYFIAPREPDNRRTKDRKTFEVSEMWDLHHEIVRRLVIGETNAEISRSLGVSKQMISYTRNSKVVRRQIDIMRGARDADTIDIAKRIRENAPKALDLLETIIEDRGETYPISLAARTSESMLDRGGYAAPKRLEAVVAHFTSEEIEDLKRKALESGRDSGMVIETEFEEAGDG